MVLMSNCFSEKKMIPTQVHTWPFVRLITSDLLKMDRLTDGLAYITKFTFLYQ